MVLVYFGTLILLPLDALYLLIELFSGVGIPYIVPILLAVAFVIYAGHVVYKMPNLYQTILNIGVDLVLFGRTQVLLRFEDIAESVQNNIDAGIMTE